MRCHHGAVDAPDEGLLKQLNLSGCQPMEQCREVCGGQYARRLAGTDLFAMGAGLECIWKLLTAVPACKGFCSSATLAISYLFLVRGMGF